MTAELLAVLDSVGPSALFCTEGNRPPVLPGLIVMGLGEIGVPVSAADAKRLISRAALAPYGRGEETIVDSTVRRVWQLEPRQLALMNPAWKPFVASLLESVREDLGIAHDVRHDLYKLLVYEKGVSSPPIGTPRSRKGCSPRSSSPCPLLTREARSSSRTTESAGGSSSEAATPGSR